MPESKKAKIDKSGIEEAIAALELRLGAPHYVTHLVQSELDRLKEEVEKL